MAHHMTGAAPPPEAVPLPATTPRPGGPVGELGERLSPALPTGEAGLGRCLVACDDGEDGGDPDWSNVVGARS
jgi:hypothetical protein